MIIPVWALAVVGSFFGIVITIISYFLSKSMGQIDLALSQNHDQDLKILNLEVTQNSFKEDSLKESKQVSNLLLEIKQILQDHAKSLNHMDKNSAITAEALKKMIKLEDALNELSKKNQEMEVKLEVLIKSHE